MQMNTDDVREIVRLLGQVIEHRGELPERKRLLLQGIASMIDADAWYGVLMRVIDGHGRAVPLELLHEGFSAQQLAAYAQSRDDPDRLPPELPALRALYDTQTDLFTRTRQELVEDAAWGDSEHVKHYLPRIGFDQMIYSSYPLPEEKLCAAWTFFRKCGSRPFGKRECEIAHVVLSESRWLLRDRLPGEIAHSVAELSPRYRTVLRLLLEGMTERQVARHLFLSPHTVHDYVKGIYRHLKVESRSELLRRFMVGELVRRAE
jgi:DNA-binding CsgD family transcriptional regulator